MSYLHCVYNLLIVNILVLSYPLNSVYIGCYTSTPQAALCLPHLSEIVVAFSNVFFKVKSFFFFFRNSKNLQSPAQYISWLQIKK